MFFSSPFYFSFECLFHNAFSFASSIFLVHHPSLNTHSNIIIYYFFFLASNHLQIFQIIHNIRLLLFLEQSWRPCRYIIGATDSPNGIDFQATSYSTSKPRVKSEERFKTWINARKAETIVLGKAIRGSLFIHLPIGH